MPAGGEPAITFVPRSKRRAPVDPVRAPPPRRAAAIPQWRLEREAALRGAEPTEQPPPPQHKKWNEKCDDELTDHDFAVMLRDLEIRASAPITPLASFASLQCAARLIKLGFTTPTPVQRAAVRAALQRRDLIVTARTGSGKTLAFLLPALENRVRTLVLAPTRELALQTAGVATSLGFTAVGVVGGREFPAQAAEVAHALKAECPLIAATPGRLTDLMRQKLVDLSQFAYVVFDEADRMIDLGFEEQVAEIATALPTAKQTLMFSATWPARAEELARRHVRPDRVAIEVGAPARVVQSVELVRDRLRRVVEIVRSNKGPIIVFVATQADAESVAQHLGKAGLPAEALHGALSQTARERVLRALRAGAKCVVATDVAARGLDVPAVQLVVNYALPRDIETYMHRIGRTGRGERAGRALSFAQESDRALFPALRRTLHASGCEVPPFLGEAE